MSAVRALRELTASVEDYLKSIYELEAAGGSAGTSEIALALRIAAPSVTGMMRKLADQGLITHAPYRGVRLTESGRRAALRTIRRHRVIEAYLTSALGYSWDEVHEEAERLEHSASDDLIERMAAALGHPETDPHGAPIPTAEGRIAERELTPLATLGVGAKARVARVGDRDAERLRYLAELGMRPGAAIRVVERAPFDGPITVRLGKAVRIVGGTLAKEILVEVE